jgi:hypothetical protein
MPAGTNRQPAPKAPGGPRRLEPQPAPKAPGGPSAEPISAVIALSLQVFRMPAGLPLAMGHGHAMAVEMVMAAATAAAIAMTVAAAILSADRVRSGPPTEALASTVAVATVKSAPAAVPGAA